MTENRRKVPTLTIASVVFVLDAAGPGFLACLPRNEGMRRVYLSGKLFPFWQDPEADSARTSVPEPTLTKSYQDSAEL